MKDIKFRAKMTANDIWVYGCADPNTAKNEYLLSTFWNCVEEGLIDSETVGHYIGRKDKIGKAIYSCDIVEYPVTSFPLEVVWEDTVCGNKLRDKKGNLLQLPSYDMMRKFSLIIGNKWDNPELMEENETN